MSAVLLGSDVDTAVDVDDIVGTTSAGGRGGGGRASAMASLARTGPSRRAVKRPLPVVMGRADVGVQVTEVLTLPRLLKPALRGLSMSLSDALGMRSSGTPDTRECTPLPPALVPLPPLLPPTRPSPKALLLLPSLACLDMDLDVVDSVLPELLWLKAGCHATLGVSPLSSDGCEEVVDRADKGTGMLLTAASSNLRDHRRVYTGNWAAALNLSASTGSK